ncbi:MAG: TIGR04372 family glycosyltransferase [Acetobacteraceae bacterium]|nr:TIGR04372 family glycosyltransferase [Acetobacteraceae bacterium]
MDRLNIVLGNYHLAYGRNAFAMQAYLKASVAAPSDMSLRQHIGVTSFLTGDYVGAEAWFSSIAHYRTFVSQELKLEEIPYRILDHTWMLAIGHVAFIDTYIKATKLGWYPEKKTLLAYNAANPPSGWPLLRFFAKHITVLAANGDPTAAIDKLLFPERRPIVQSEQLAQLAQLVKLAQTTAAARTGEMAQSVLATPPYIPEEPRPDTQQRDAMRRALSQDFWSGPDGSGRIRWFGPWGAAVEAAWKESGRPALFGLDADERNAFRRLMAQSHKLPEDAWYVLLHVREPGFHGRWHKAHPGTRNAEIGTYDKIIDFVVSRGGWVVRGGDPAMQPIPRREKVIDYATSDLRSPEIDVLLCADCAYFAGTNSGYSVLPPVFGKRCALTNWSPIAIPNWYPDDIYIPKLVRDTKQNRYLTFQEMYSSFAGWSQFQRDFDRTDLRVEDNSPDDLLDAVMELHAEVFDEARGQTAEDEARLQRFNEIVLANGGYIGSRMSSRFLRRHADLLRP